MRKTSLDELETRMGPADVQLPLTDALGLANAALNYYELAPGDSFAYGFHAHEDQEELFYVQSGTVTFRTVDGDVPVSAGEFARFGPAEYQRGVNEGDERVVAVALGAPREAGETELLRECADCGGDTPHEVELADDSSEVVARCEECGAVTGRYE